MLRMWKEETVFLTKQRDQLRVWQLRTLGGDWLALIRNRPACSEVGCPSCETRTPISEQEFQY